MLMKLGDDIPEGWPRFAHDQNYGHNRSIHRRFGDLHQRLLLDYEITLKLIFDDIIQLDKADEKADGRILRGLSPHQSFDNGDGLNRFEKKRELIREAKEILPKYCKLPSPLRMKKSFERPLRLTESNSSEASPDGHRGERTVQNFTNRARGLLSRYRRAEHPG